MKVKKKFLTDGQIEEAAGLFRILAEPSRLKLLRSLMKEGRTVTELVESTEMGQGNVSKHLGVLLAARLVRKEKAGNFACYSIADKSIFKLCDLVCKRMENEARKRLKDLTGKG